MPTTLRGSDNFDSASLGLGFGQTWQNVTASRSANGTSYTNSTGKPIMVSIQGAATSGFNIVIGGVTIMNFSNNIQSTVSFIVPNGTSYSANIPAGINNWSELR